jgi:DNA-binding SARP family transcriptional activator/tetratricopeptide (TPR) repeat protein
LPVDEVEIRLLGPPQVEIAGVPLEVDTRKAIAIIARLALEGPQRRETLAALLWPESDRVRARGALRRTLSALKARIHGSVLAIGRDEVHLEPGAYVCDVDRFRRLVVRAREHHGPATTLCERCTDDLSDAVALHRDDLLAGFSLRGSPDFDDWQLLQVEALHAELAAALDPLINALAHRGDLIAAEQQARRRLKIDPLHEPTHRRLMLIDAWAGRREDAVRQYRQCVTVLENELGVPPLEETTNLYQSILTGRAPAQPSAVRNGQAPVRSLGSIRTKTAVRPPESGLPLPLVGRDHQLGQLMAVHEGSGDHGCLVVVEGEAGIGKSRLLDEFGMQVRRTGSKVVTVRCYRGQETLPYAPIADALRTVGLDDDLLAVVRPWLSEVTRLVPELLQRGGSPAPTAPLASAEADRRFFEGVRQILIAAAPPGRPVLLVIEDMQWVDAASQDVVTYLAHRLEGVRLQLALSWRSEAVGRDHPVRRLLNDPRTTTRTTQVVLGRLTSDQVIELAEAFGVHGDAAGKRLFRETDGLPLFTVEYLRARGNGVADDANWTVPASVHDLLSQRLGQLSETARQVLTTAAVLGRSFDLVTLLHASGRAAEETIDALEELLAADIVAEVVAEPGRSGATYDFRHHATRSVVYEDASIARRRLLHARAAESLRRRGRASDTPVPLPVVAEHLRLAGEDRDAARMFALAGDGSRKLLAHADAVEHYRAALALGHPHTARLHEAIGELLTPLGDYRGALNSFEVAAAHGTTADELARIEQHIATVHERLGNWSAAEAHVEAALAILTTEGDTVLRAKLEATASLTAYRRGDVADARERAERSLRLAEARSAMVAAAHAHNILGIICRSEGAPEQAVVHLRRSLELADEAEDLGPRVAALNNLALALADRGELPAALELSKTALGLCRTHGDRHHEAAILNNLADLLRAVGQDEEAMRHVKEAVKIFAAVGEPDHLEPEIWKLVDW